MWILVYWCLLLLGACATLWSVLNGRFLSVKSRFLLDGLPAKQMVIDNRFSRGEIDDAEAIEEKRQLQGEVDAASAQGGILSFLPWALAPLTVFQGLLVLGVVFLGSSPASLTVAVANFSLTIVLLVIPQAIIWRNLWQLTKI